MGRALKGADLVFFAALFKINVVNRGPKIEELVWIADRGRKTRERGKELRLLSQTLREHSETLIKKGASSTASSS